VRRAPGGAAKRLAAEVKAAQPDEVGEALKLEVSVELLADELADAEACGNDDGACPGLSCSVARRRLMSVRRSLLFSRWP
jgi:hypothetical protein